MTGQRHEEKRGVAQRFQKKLTEETSYRPRLAVIINSGGGNGNVDESLNSGGSEAFIGGCSKSNGIRVSGSMVVNGEA